MGTKSNPGAFDCYANAEPDEPMFVLLGRDKHAPALVWLWAVLRELDGEDPAKVHEARQCCVNMAEFAHDRGKQSVGVAHSVLAGVFELMRAANTAVKGAKNDPTTVDQFRVFLCQSRFEDDKPIKDDTKDHVPLPDLGGES
jgi:hypothetical protein